MRKASLDFRLHRVTQQLLSSPGSLVTELCQLYAAYTNWTQGTKWDVHMF